MTTINVSGQITNEDLLLCDSTKLLMNCRDFYILLERFCNGIVKSNPQYDEFLNLYFNDEGYVDIWRIPHLMLDAFNQNLKFIKCSSTKSSGLLFTNFSPNSITFA